METKWNRVVFSLSGEGFMVIYHIKLLVCLQDRLLLKCVEIIIRNIKQFWCSFVFRKCLVDMWYDTNLIQTSISCTVIHMALVLGFLTANVPLFQFAEYFSWPVPRSSHSSRAKRPTQHRAHGTNEYIRPSGMSVRWFACNEWSVAHGVALLTWFAIKVVAGGLPFSNMASDRPAAVLAANQKSC